MDPKKNIQGDRIERLQKELYSRNELPVSENPSATLHEKNIEVATSWGQPKTFDYTVDPMTRRKSNSFFNKFFIISSVVFLVALSVALYIFFGGINMISSNNLDVRIVAPSSISSGEELAVGLTIINGNNADLDDVIIYVDYPDGSQEIGTEKNLSHDKISLGTIEKGNSKEYSLRNTVFGEKDEIKDYRFRIEYKVKGSNATFSKEKSYSVSIASAPILMNINYPKEANSSQEIKFNIELTSNSAVVLKNTLIKIDYPYGFTYKSSSLKPLKNSNIWNIGDMANGDKKILTVVGVLLGQNQEDKTFRVAAGTQSQDPTKDFEASLVEQDATVGIRKSFFDLGLEYGNADNIKMGDSTGVAIKWQNTLPDKIRNAKVVATISGNALDRSKVNVGNEGYYRSIDNNIIWDKNSSVNLDQILPGDGGTFSFNVGSFTDPNLAKSIKNPHINVHVVMTGDRSGPNGESVSSVGDIQIKLLSVVNLISKSYRNVGPFKNTGPLPPKADKESTYTITWTITNTTNDISNAVVKARLPIGVEWKESIYPANEKIGYDRDARSITWNVGNVSAGAGFSSSARTVSFQVVLLPSLSQVRSTPELVSTPTLTSTDSYAAKPLTVSADPVDTYVSDPGFRDVDSEVVP